MENKAVKKYLSRLRRALTYSREDRERLLAQGRALLEGFGEENPEPSYEDLSAAFGQPKEFAAEMLSQLDPAEVEQARKRRRYIRWGTAAALAAVLILCAVFWHWKWVKAQNVINGDFYIVEEDVVIITDDEVDRRMKENSEEANSFGGGQK